MINDNLVKVEGHSGLYKNMKTGVIVNMDKIAISSAKERKIKRMSEEEDNLKLKSDVEFLKNEMSEIKCILKHIIEK